jgi:hypothetical protein
MPSRRSHLQKWWNVIQATKAAIRVLKLLFTASGNVAFANTGNFATRAETIGLPSKKYFVVRNWYDGKHADHRAALVRLEWVR